jgi:hypothetical protein
VPLILPDDQRQALREDCLGALHGILDDLGWPDRPRDPVVTAREGEVFRRLLEALDEERIVLPDEEMRKRIDRLSESHDEMEDHDEIAIRHAAHEALLGVLAGACLASEEVAAGDDPEGEEDGSSRQGPGWDTDDAYDSSRREVLDLLLEEAPDCLTLADLKVALAGHPPTWEEKDTLEIATRALVRDGLVRSQGDLLFAPTRPARRMAELGFSIG